MKVMDRLNVKILMQCQTLIGVDPEEIVIGLGILFEHGRRQNEIKFILHGLSLSKNIDFTDFHAEQIQTFHFNMANGWSYLEGLTRPQNHFEVNDFQTEELEQQIIHLRRALIYAESWSADTRKCEILTNLGNLFNKIGRFSESMRYYNEALAIEPDYGQTLANKANTIFGYSRILYDGNQQVYFLKKAYNVFGNALRGHLYEETRHNVLIMRNKLESFFPKSELEYDYQEDSFEIGNTKEEMAYREWVLSERLFLNPINDITDKSIAAHDCLLLPSLTSKDNKPEFFQILFNQIKQEFGTARYFFYEGIFSLTPHFSDRGNLLLDLSKGNNYSLAVEKIKASFKICYSILDKIAYLLNDYLELGWNLKSVNFRRIWYSVEGGKGIKVMDKISATENWAFRGLFWVNKDFYEKSIPYLTSIAPESKEMAEIRNFMEHKSFNVISDSMEILIDKSDKSYWIKRNELQKKTRVLIQTVRAAIIYLSLGINLHESKKVNNGPTIPIYPIIKDDEEKF